MSQKFETFTESGVEADFLKWLEGVGWTVYGKGDTWGATVLDNKFERERNEPIYWNLLKEKVKELNEEITENNIERFISSLKQELSFDNLMEANQKFHKLLIKGKKFSITRENGSQETVPIYLADIEHPEKNSLIAANQFRIRNKKFNKRPDINLFINGIPIVTIELKSSTSNKDYYNAIEDLREYEDSVPRLFVPGLLNVAADSMELRYGSVRAPIKDYFPWNNTPYEKHIDLKETVKSLLDPEKILEVLDNFVIYKRTSKTHCKLIPRYMQYFASKKLLRRVRNNERNRGLIWHTQGSGKSLTMLYTAKNLINRDILENPQVLVLVDREKLENQMKTELNSIDFDQFDIAQDGKDLERLLESGKSTLILTTIQKFQNVSNNSQGNPDTIVLTDESHRFMEKNLGSKLDAVLPNCMHFGFTGTPVEEGKSEKDRNTFRHYSNGKEQYMDHYSMKQGIKDNFILPVFFDERSAIIEGYDEDKIDKLFEREIQTFPEEEKSKAIRESVSKRDIEELRPRIEKIAEDIHEHFKSVEKNGFKGMVITPRREVAAMYGEILQEKRDKEEVKVLISNAGKSSQLTEKFNTTSDERDNIVDNIHQEENPKLVVVVDMLLTGFDESKLKTIYLDRDLKNHSLLQAIARTNRVEEGKNNGEIVDYRGVFEEVDKYLDYSEEVKETAAINKDVLFEGLDEQDVKGFKPLLSELISIFEGIEKKDSQETMEKCITRLNKDPEVRKEFLQGMRELQDLYESIQPDPRMADQEIRDKYKWLSQVKIAFNASRSDPSEQRKLEKVREKTKEILEENINIEEVRDDFGSYKLNEKHLEDLEDLEPSVKATKVANATKNHLIAHQGENPRYRRLSERLEEVIEKWQSDEISDQNALSNFEEIETSTLNVKKEAEDKDLKDYEHAFYDSLSEDYGEYVENDQEAQDIAEKLGEKFREEVDTSFEGWHKNESVRNSFEKAIIDVLVKEFNKYELYNQNKTSLKEDFWIYLVENLAK